MKNTIKIFSVVIAGFLIIGLSSVAGSQTQSSATTDLQKNQLRDLMVTRTFEAPIAEVWKYWAEADYVKKWWSPTGYTTPLAKMDFREGGTSLVCMRSPQGQDLYSTWTYRKIVPLELIEYIHYLTDKDGNRADPVKMGLPADFPQGVRNVITFKTVGNKTEMTVTEYGYHSEQWLKLSRLGLEQCLNKMAAALTQS
ncbi:MAG: SRPBCC domain-containing protein [Acidobacteriota bacterium]